MKKINVILAGIAVMSLAVSCNGFLGDLGIMAPGVDMKISHESEVSSQKLANLDGISYVKVASQGDLFVEKVSTEPAKATCSTTTGTVNFTGSRIAIDGADLPDATKPLEGAILSSAIIVTVENPTPEPVGFESTVVIDGKPGTVTGMGVADNSIKDFGLCVGDANEIKERTNYEDPVLLSDELADPLSDGIDEVVLEDMAVTFKKGSKVAPAAGGSYQFNVKAKYYASLSYLPGTKLQFVKTFNDLGVQIDIDKVFKEYDIYFSVESTIPFDIKFSATSPDGLVGTSDDVIKAGAPGAPVKSAVVMHVVDNSGNKINAISTATVTLDLTAVEGAKFSQGQSLKIDTSKLTIVKL